MTVIISGDDGVSDVDGSAGTPAIRGTDANTGIFFPAADTIAFAEGGAEAMRINSSGQVGIGTSSPSAKLTVAGGDVRIDTDDNGVIWGNNGIFGNNASDFITIETVDIERARITSGGELLVGTTTAIFSSRVLQAVRSGGGPCVFKTEGSSGSEVILVWNNATSGNNLFQEFGTEGSFTVRGTIDYNRAAGLTRYNTTSDATLKNIIGDSNGQKSVEILNSTRIREFTWKDDETQKPQIGVIAQELHEVYKGAVMVGGDIEETDSEGNVTTKYRPWGVDKTAFTFHLVAGWQAHEKIIKQQADMIAALEARIAALEAQ